MKECEGAIDTWPETVALLGTVFLYGLIMVAILGFAILVLASFGIRKASDDE
jgi:hypothetical protein